MVRGTARSSNPLRVRGLTSIERWDLEAKQASAWAAPPHLPHLAGAYQRLGGAGMPVNSR